MTDHAKTAAYLAVVCDPRTPLPAAWAAFLELEGLGFPEARLRVLAAADDWNGPPPNFANLPPPDIREAWPSQDAGG